MAKRYDFTDLKRTTVDSDDRESDAVHGIWYKNQRYFSKSIFTVTVEGSVATVDYFKGNLDFKSGGKPQWGFCNSGDRGDLECPVIHEIGDTPVIVFSEEWKNSGGWNGGPYSELFIYSYNGGYRQFDNVYTVKGRTFLIGRLLYELGFRGEKVDGEYVYSRPTPEEEEAMNKEEAESRRLYGLAKKKEHEENKAKYRAQFLEAAENGNLVLDAQVGKGYSPITGISIPPAPEGTIYVFSWHVLGEDPQLYGIYHKLTKKLLKDIGVEVVKSQNRWSRWFYAVKIEDLAKFTISRHDYEEYCSAYR